MVWVLLDIWFVLENGQKRFKIPIFSIDYRTAPENQFPACLEDCWNAYKWIINYGSKHLKIDPSKVILIGDSAGGNLILGITILCIVTNFRKPDKLILGYPALDLSLNRFYPSLMNGLNDILLNFNVMKFMRDKYVGEENNPDTDPLISPIVVSDEILWQFPRTRIMTGTVDPIRDQSYRFLYRLLKLHWSVKFKEYLLFPHGFLNMMTPISSLIGVEKANNDVWKWINETIEANAKNRAFRKNKVVYSVNKQT